MKRMFLFFLCLFVPWFVLLINDNPGGALIALIMQATVIGWLPAFFWARRVVKRNQAEQDQQ